MAAAKKNPAKSPLIADKLNRDLIVAALEALKIAFDAKASTLVLGEVLNAYYVKNTSKANMVLCDVCGMTSNDSLDACPGCGAGDEESGDALNEGEEEATPGDAEATPEEGEEEATPEETSADATPKKRGRPAKAAIVVAPEVLPEGVTEDALNEGVARYKALESQSYGSFWEIGKSLADLFDKQLWKARRDKDGNPAYKNFDTFTRAELNVSNVQALKYMQVSKAFTKEQVVKLGTSKLGLILDAPEADRPKLLEAADKGASKRDLEATLKDVKEKAKAAGQDLHAEKDKEKGGKSTGAGKGREIENVKIAAFIGKKSVPLFKCPAKGKLPEEIAMGDAINDADGIVGSLELGGVLFFFNVVKLANGQISLKVNGTKSKKGLGRYRSCG